jgi:Lrp/AsnC family leucine-responsive transcriptional regulator
MALILLCSSISAFDWKVDMDAVDRQLLEALQDDARTSYTELGRMVSLTPPAVAERVRRLENSGIITGYHAHVDLKKAGYGLMAFIRLNSAPELAKQLGHIATETPEVLEFYNVTGTESFMLKAVARSIEHLEKVISLLLPYGHTTTSIVLSSPVTWRRIEFAENDEHQPTRRD